jgi:hypothetical protein
MREVYAEMVKKGEARPGATPQMVATITNVGRRAILASKLAGRRPNEHGKKRWFVFKPRAFPRTLQPSEYTMEWSDDPAVFSDDIRGFYVFDSAGRQWSVKRRQVRQYKAEVKRLRDEGVKR